MKRDMELIRKLVLALEDMPRAYAPDNLMIEGYDQEQIGYHSYLICDAGLAEGDDDSEEGDTSPMWSLGHLTWAGHEFAQVARDQTTWNRVMGIIKEKGGAVTLTLLTQLLTTAMQKQLGLG